MSERTDREIEIIQAILETELENYELVMPRQDDDVLDHIDFAVEPPPAAERGSSRQSAVSPSIAELHAHFGGVSGGDGGMTASNLADVLKECRDGRSRTEGLRFAQIRPRDRSEKETRVVIVSLSAETIVGRQT